MSCIDQVAKQLRSLRLHHLGAELETLLSSAEANELSYLQFAQTLADHEIRQRSLKRIELNRRKSAIAIPKSLDEFDYRHQTTITKRQINQLLDFSFLDNRSNLVFIGPPEPGS